MDKLPAWVAKVGLFWVAIGTFLMSLSQTGTAVPEFLTGLFSQDTWNAFLLALGGVLDFAQLIKVLFATLKKPDAEISILSNSVKLKHFNPLYLG